MRYSDSISLGNSPTIRDLERLARKSGFRAILNLNTEGETAQILSPNVEASWAHTFDMQHEWVAVDLRVLRSERVDKVLETLREIAKPVYVHSLMGRRAAAFMTIHLALERGIPGERGLSEAKALGIDCSLEPLQRFTASEVERCASAARLPEAIRPEGSSVSERSETDDGERDEPAAQAD